MKNILSELRAREAAALANSEAVANSISNPPTQVDFINITCAQLRTLMAQVAVLQEQVRELDARTIRQVRLGGC